MKTLSAGLLMITLCTGLAACNELSEQERAERLRIEQARLTDDVYYVAGYNAGPNMVFVDDNDTFRSTAYLFISENLLDTVAVHNRTTEGQPGRLFDGIYELPAEFHKGPVHGFVLFPKECRYSYPVKILSHRPLTEDESLGGFANAYYRASSIQVNKSIVVESLAKIEKR